MSDVKNILSDELESLKLRIIANHEKAGQKASGRTEASLRVEVTEDEGIIFGRNAFGTLETGRKGGNVPSNFSDIIKKWARDKGINISPIPYKTDRAHKYSEQERGENRFAFFVARKIKRDGTALYRSGGRSDIYSDEIRKTIKVIGDRLMSSIKMEIDSIKLNTKEEI